MNQLQALLKGGLVAFLGMALLTACAHTPQNNLQEDGLASSEELEGNVNADTSEDLLDGSSAQDVLSGDEGGPQAAELTDPTLEEEVASISEGGELTEADASFQISPVEETLDLAKLDTPIPENTQTKPATRSVASSHTPKPAGAPKAEHSVTTQTKPPVSFEQESDSVTPLINQHSEDSLMRSSDKPSLVPKKGKVSAQTEVEAEANLASPNTPGDFIAEHWYLLAILISVLGIGFLVYRNAIRNHRDDSNFL